MPVEQRCSLGARLYDAEKRQVAAMMVMMMTMNIRGGFYLALWL
jgi:hypothetical protein